MYTLEDYVRWVAESMGLKLEDETNENNVGFIGKRQIYRSVNGIRRKYFEAL